MRLKIRFDLKMRTRRSLFISKNVQDEHTLPYLNINKSNRIVPNCKLDKGETTDGYPIHILPYNVDPLILDIYRIIVSLWTSWMRPDNFVLLLKKQALLCSVVFNWASAFQGKNNLICLINKCKETRKVDGFPSKNKLDIYG